MSDGELILELYGEIDKLKAERDILTFDHVRMEEALNGIIRQVKLGWDVNYTKGSLITIENQARSTLSQVKSL